MPLGLKDQLQCRSEHYRKETEEEKSHQTTTKRLLHLVLPKTYPLIADTY